MKYVSSICLLGVVALGLTAGCSTEKKNATCAEERKIVGYMLDVSRFRVPTMETVKRQVDILADLGYNHFQLYTEHTFAYPGHEDVWREASPFTPDEMRASSSSPVSMTRFSRAFARATSTWAEMRRWSCWMTARSASDEAPRQSARGVRIASTWSS